MSMNEKQAAAPTTTDILITRVFDAPRELVWKAWTEPASFMRWWGPKDYTCPTCTMDFRVGGKYVTAMRSPEGKDFWSTGVYREIVPMERLVMTDNFADEHGNIVSGDYYGLPGDWNHELVLTVTFQDFQGKTKMTLHHVGHPSGEMGEMEKQGWNESLDKLEAGLHDKR